MPTDYFFFWKPEKENGWAGQWHWEAFTINEITFPTAEHYMMYHKAILFNDEAIAAQILEATDPKLVRELGRKVSNFNQKAWEDARFGIVVKGNLAKFTASPTLKAKLLATGDKRLVEASPRDKIWGIGYGAENALKNHRSWGTNLLGKALEKVREQLREEQASQDQIPEGSTLES